MSPRFTLSYFDPPEALRRHVLVLFHFAWDEPVFADLHPGALGQLVLFPHGHGQIDFDHGSQPVDGEALMFAGFTKAAAFTMQGPWHSIGASLSPLGWAALTGQPKNTHIDRFIRAEELLGPAITDFASAICEDYRAGAIDGEAAASKLCEWIEARLGTVPIAHQRVIEQTLKWLGSSLNPPVEDLFDRIHYSRRQAERLVERYFGFPPAALARKYRAIRAAAILAEESPDDHAIAELADAFYDQPHMVREIRHFCGFTPSRLGGPSNLLFQQLLRMKNFERLHNFTAS